MIQGEDIKVRFTLTNGTIPIVPSTLNAYAISVYYVDEFGEKILLATYKGSTGLYDIVVFSNTLGQLDIIINRELTRGLGKCKVYGEVFIQETATAEFISSLSRNGVNEIFLFDFGTSANSNPL